MPYNATHPNYDHLRCHWCGELTQGTGPLGVACCPDHIQALDRDYSAGHGEDVPRPPVESDTRFHCLYTGADYSVVNCEQHKDT